VKIFVTGGTGFIGSVLTEQLLEEGNEVYGLVRHSPRKAEIPKEVKIVVGDLLDFYNLKKAMRDIQPDVVLHIGAITPVRYSFENPFIYMLTNMIGTMHMAHASMESSALKQFIFASTAEVYIAKNGTMLEEDPVGGQTPYGVSKASADHYVQMAGQVYGLPYVLMRPCNSYGRTKEKGYLVESVLTQMIAKKPKIHLSGVPEPKRTWMFVTDHVNAYMTVIKKGVTNKIFNVATRDHYSIAGMVDICKEVTGYEGEVEWGMQPRPFDPPMLCLDNGKIGRELGWKPEVSLEEGLKRTAMIWGTLK